MAARRNRKNTEAETENTVETTEPTEAEATITEPTTEATDTEPATETPATEATETRIDTAALIAQAEAEATEQRDHTQADYDKIAQMYKKLILAGENIDDQKRAEIDHLGRQQLTSPDYDEAEYIALRKWGRAVMALNTATVNVKSWIDSREYTKARAAVGDVGGWVIERISEEKFRLGKDGTNPIEATEAQMVLIAPALVGDAEAVDRMMIAARLQPLQKRRKAGNGTPAAYKWNEIAVPNSKHMGTHGPQIVARIKALRAEEIGDTKIADTLIAEGYGTKNDTAINPGQIGNIRRKNDIA